MILFSLVLMQATSIERPTLETLMATYRDCVVTQATRLERSGEEASKLAEIVPSFCADHLQPLVEWRLEETRTGLDDILDEESPARNADGTISFDETFVSLNMIEDMERWGEEVAFAKILSIRADREIAND